MLKIQNNKFEIKFTEINIRQRMYQGESYVTLIINTEFFPALVDENIINGSIEVKLDLKNIKSLDDLVDKEYNGDIGNITISVNNNGIWEHNSKDDFKAKIIKRYGNKLDFEIISDNCELVTTGTIVSLYTTSTNQDELSKKFNLNDFYPKPIIKEIGASKIYKYYVK